MHKPSYRASIVAIFLVSVILIFPEVTEAQKLVVGWSAVSALNSPYWVIKDAGFAKQEGLDADLIYIPSSSTMAQAQLAGNVAISTANSQVVVDVGLQGGDLVAMGAVINEVAFYVMAPPEIKVVRKNRIFEIQINLAHRFFLFRKNHRAQSVVSMPTA